MERRYVQPAVVGGLVIGVLSALPLISAGNICCCLWVILGGVTAAYLLQQGQAEPMTAGDGALVGLIAGAIGAVCYLLISIPVTVIVSPLERAVLQRLYETGGGMPPEVRGYMDGPLGTVIRLVLGFLFMLFAGPAFATLGGLLGAALFRTPRPVVPAAPAFGGYPVVPSAPTVPPVPPPAGPAPGDEGTGPGPSSSE